MACIFVADDNNEQLAVQRSLLEAVGYEVATASTPPEVFEELLRRTPDVMILDLNLPHADDGLGLIRAIREAGYRAPIIVLSGWPEEILGAPEEQLVSRVMIKGNVRELLRTIEELLGGS
jgi:CheY-like chemotaxis protein